MDSNNIFAVGYTGGVFVFFGPAHIITLLIILSVIVFFFLWRNPGDKACKRMRYLLSILIIVNELALHAYLLLTGQWSIQTMLPFHICAALIWMTPFMLIGKNYQVYELYYFLGLAGATQALLTPDVGIYGFPHFRYFSAFISHGLIVLSAVYMTAVEHYRPTWRSLVNVAWKANLYMVFVFVINSLIGSNYMFIAHKPDTLSLIDLLGPWPLYILILEAIAFVLFLLLYMPFAIKDWRAKRPGQAVVS